MSRHHGRAVPDRSPRSTGTDVVSIAACVAVCVSVATGVLAGAPRRQVELADPALVATPEKREDIEYLAQCALPEDVELRSRAGEAERAFPGKIGLAPSWLREPLTESQARWVSACMLAHTNAFGKHVMISLRADPAPVPFLRPDEEEKARFEIFEGGFFGDLFSRDAVGYVCSGGRTPGQAAAPILRDRVCTEPSGDTSGDGKPITRCGLVLTGPCSDPASFLVNGRRYTEVIYTYLAAEP